MCETPINNNRVTVEEKVIEAGPASDHRLLSASLVVRGKPEFVRTQQVETMIQEGLHQMQPYAFHKDLFKISYSNLPAAGSPDISATLIQHNTKIRCLMMRELSRCRAAIDIGAGLAAFEFAGMNLECIEGYANEVGNLIQSYH